MLTRRAPRLLLLLLACLWPVAGSGAQPTLPPVGLQVAFDNGSLFRVDEISGQSVMLHETLANGTWRLHVLLGGLYRQATLLGGSGGAEDTVLRITFDEAEALRHLPPQAGSDFVLDYSTERQGAPLGGGTMQYRVEEGGAINVGGRTYATLLLTKDATFTLAAGGGERVVSREWYAPELGLVLQQEAESFTLDGQALAKRSSRATAITFP